jgi:hypothetical protein
MYRVDGITLGDADLQLEHREHLTKLVGISPALTAIPIYRVDGTIT